MKIRELKEFINQLPDEVDDFHLRIRNIDSWNGVEWQGWEMLLEGAVVDEPRRALVFMDKLSSESFKEKHKEVAMEVFDRDQKERDDKKNETD